MLASKGIIFRVVKYGETSIICDIYTEADGLKSFIINGVRKKKSRYPASLFQPMYLVDLVAYENPKRSLNRIKEISSDYVYQSIPFEITKSSIGIFAIEVIRKSIKEEEENIPLFEFIRSFFLSLDRAQDNYFNYHLWMMVHLCHHLGFIPDGICDDRTPYLDIENGKFVSGRTGFIQMDQQSSSDFFALMHLDLKDTHQLKMNHQGRNKLIEDLVRYYQFHIEGLQAINAHHVLAKVFS
ncbi:MAG: DNA repair protein RecO [Bacteroidia bacterium]|nr:DNA repair protein RecO [Bacteroidia bacterium]